MTQAPDDSFIPAPVMAQLDTYAADIGWTEKEKAIVKLVICFMAQNPDDVTVFGVRYVPLKDYVHEHTKLGALDDRPVDKELQPLASEAAFFVANAKQLTGIGIEMYGPLRSGDATPTAIVEPRP